MSEQEFFATLEPQVNYEIMQGYKMEKIRMQSERTEEEKKKKLFEALMSIMNNVKIKVPTLKQKDLSKIDAKNLESEFQDAIVSHSNVIDDIFSLTNAIVDMKTLRNSIASALHHKLKFKNQFLLKTSKEVQTYMDGDDIFNQVNMQIKRAEAQLEKSKELSSTLKQKIGFIRDLTKYKTQEMFGEARG